MQITLLLYSTSRRKLRESTNLVVRCGLAQFPSLNRVADLEFGVGRRKRENIHLLNPSNLHTNPNSKSIIAIFGGERD